MTHHTGSDEGRALADVIAKHRSPTERSDNGTPMCDCGHDLGWDESWPEHLASVLAARAAAPDALREAWDKGYASGFSNAMRRMSDEPNAPTSPNPYRAALADPTDGATT